MSLILSYDNHASPWEPIRGQEIIFESRLNLLAWEYGYRYRLDICTTSGMERVEFVRTLREARFVGMPARKTGGLVKFFKLYNDGTLKRHQW